MLNYPVVLSHPRSPTVSLKTFLLYSYYSHLPTTTLVMTKLVLTGVNYSYSFIANKIILGVFITGRPKEDQEFRYGFLTF